MKIIQSIINNKYLIGFFITLLVAWIFEKNIRYEPNQNVELNNVQRVIAEKTKEVDNILGQVESKLDSISLKDLMYSQDFVANEVYKDKGIVFLGYSADSLVFWTDNLVPVTNYNVENQLYNDVAKLKNGWYVIRHNYIDDYELFGLILIKNDYDYQNEFIRSDFFKDYDIEIPVSIGLQQSEGYQVTSHTGEYLFSLQLKSSLVYNKTNVYISSGLYFLSIVLLFLFLRKYISTIKANRKRNVMIGILAVFLCLTRFHMLEYHFPMVFKQLELFQPHHFAISVLVPSLGDLLLHAGFMLFFFLIFYFYFDFKLHSKIYVQYIITFLLIILSFALFVYINYFFESLILHSSISFNVHQFFDLSIYSIVGFLIIVLYLLTLFLFLDKAVKLISSYFSLKKFLIILIVLFLVFVLFVYTVFDQYIVYSLIFLGTVFFYIAIIRFNNQGYSYARIIGLLLILSLFTVVFINVTSNNKDEETRKVLALNLANEHDQIAEMLLEDLETEIERDTVIRDLLTWHHQNEGAIYDYLQTKYFSGYLRKYMLDISVCDPYDELTVELENSVEIHHCYTFFNGLLEEDGIQLQNSRFYFLDNLDGLISYTGQFIFKKPAWENEVTLSISLHSKLISQELGYPELLLDSRMSGSKVLSDYSYAKYKNTGLMSQSGEFSYQLSFPESWDSDQEFYFFSDNKYEHLIYRIDDASRIVVSNYRVRFIDVMASFSYIFVFYYILYSLVMFLVGFPENIREFNYDFKNKIKFSMIGVLLLSLIIVGFGTIYYNINQFEQNLYERISEKIQSVKVEMENKLGGDFELIPEESDYYEYLLTKFSRVFNIDINLYDVDGNLLASSRPQVFEKGLMGNKLNVSAYEEMVVKRSGRYIHREKIGDLSYYSAYIPFSNDYKELLAYINLPYFTKQSELRKEIYTIVVAVVNIYFFLILLSVVVAIFVSNNITKPLELIQEKFRAIDLGKKNEPIVYTSKDEIGSLIKEYNRMVSELSENADKLAKSERESAWREMAKQIAHEIKNPLTPMKLSVQYLQKAWNDEIPDFDKRLEKFSNSLISQINNLSNIATEFSNFAKMPRARAEEVNIISKLSDSINLLESTENVKFKKDFKGVSELYVYADKEQVLIVFSNLIQNGIQAVPKDRDAVINIKVEEIKDKVKISIKDNGSGVPEDVREKLFIPNFTTKTSGMGLGLAIVKNIIVNAGGDIWYETEMGVGTTFYVTFPIYKQS